MRTFSIIGDKQLCQHIGEAQRKLVFIAPGVTKPVAEAIAQRLNDLGSLSVTVIVDTDPEVCRMGYGDLAALEILQRCANAQQLALRNQPGLRVGVLVADDVVTVYSPTPRLIEAGSATKDKPNAIVLDGAMSAMLEEAAGSDSSGTLPREAEIGQQVITEEALSNTREDLKNAPPQRFDLARQARVFSSLIGYVELEIKGVRIAQRRLKIPTDLLHADASDDVLDGLTADVKLNIADEDFTIDLVLSADGVLVEEPTESTKTVAYTPRRLADEAKTLREDYLFVLRKYGTVIYTSQKSAFEVQAEAYKARLQAYLKKLSERLSSTASKQIDQIVNLIMRRLNGNRPRGMRPKDFPGEISDDTIKSYVRGRVQEAFQQAYSLNGDVRWIYKSISPDSVAQDSEFLKAVAEQFSESERQRLFEQYNAARGEQ